MAKTQKFDWTQFRQRIEIKAPPAKVFRAWTDDKTITKWFTVKANIEPKKSGRLYFEWLAGDKMETKILAIKKNSLLRFPFGKNNEQVEVKFKKVKGGTLCELHQFNMGTSEKEKWGMFTGCKEGWAFFLTNLKSFLEHEIDLRSHNPKKSYKDDYINS